MEDDCLGGPCPFCGERELELDYSRGEDDAFVTCENCFARGPVATLGCRDEDEDGPIDLEKEAVELWNGQGFGGSPRGVELFTMPCRIVQAGAGTLLLMPGEGEPFRVPVNTGGKVGDECVLRLELIPALVVESADHAAGVITLRRNDPERPS